MMTQAEWKEFLIALSERPNRDHPKLHGLIFAARNNGAGALPRSDKEENHETD